MASKAKINLMRKMKMPIEKKHVGQPVRSFSENFGWV